MDPEPATAKVFAPAVNPVRFLVLGLSKTWCKFGHSILKTCSFEMVSDLHICSVFIV